MAVKKSKRESPSFFSKFSSDSAFGLFLVGPLTIILFGMVLYPLIYSFWVSLNWLNLRTGVSNFVWFENYFKATGDPLVLLSLWNSVQFSIIATALTVPLSIGLALVMNESFKGRSVVRVAVILPFVASEYLTGIIWLYLYHYDIGFFNGILLALGAITADTRINFFATVPMLSTAVAYSWRLAPLGAFFILASLQVIPQDLYNQAKVDGLGPIRRFVHVSLPYLRNPLLMILVLTTLFSLTTTDIIIALTYGGPGYATHTATFLIYKETFVLLNLGYASAISYFLLALTLIFGTFYFVLLTRRRGL